MKAESARRLAYIVLTAALFVVAALQVQNDSRTLTDPTPLTGYYLFGLMIFLAVFNTRKKLSMLPIGSVSFWLRLHVSGGLLTLGLFWLHIGKLWPNGGYEQVLAFSFYAVNVTGILGYIILKVYPSRMTQIGLEVIYERIPADVAAMREAAEAIILKCTEETGSDTIARHFWSHALGSQASSHWIRHEVENLRRYLNDAEQLHLDSLMELAFIKSRVDFHYAAQTIMKGWLLVHLPLAVAVMALAAWHFILVHVYIL